MMTRTNVVCLVTFLLSKPHVFGRFCPKLPRFISLFSVTLVTFHKATFIKLNYLRGGGLQTKIGGR